MKQVMIFIIKGLILLVLVIGWIVGKEMGVSSLVRSFLLLGLGSLVLSFGNKKNEKIDIVEAQSINKPISNKNSITFKPLYIYLLSLILILSPYLAMMLKETKPYYHSLHEHLLIAAFAMTLSYWIVFKTRYKRIVKNIALLIMIVPSIYYFIENSKDDYVDFSISVFLISMFTFFLWYNKNGIMELNEKLKED